MFQLPYLHLDGSMRIKNHLTFKLLKIGNGLTLFGSSVSDLWLLILFFLPILLILSINHECGRLCVWTSKHLPNMMNMTILLGLLFSFGFSF